MCYGPGAVLVPVVQVAIPVPVVEADPVSQKRIASAESERPTLRRRRCVIIGAVCMSAMIPGCRQASPADRAASAPHQTAAGTGTSAGQPSVVDPGGEESPPVDVPAKPASTALEGFGGERSGWLKIELLREDATVGWATGSIHPGSNSIEIETEGARRILLDLSQIHVDWSRRVILRIDGQGSQLLHGKTQIKHLEVTPAGLWRVIRGDDAAATSEQLPTD